MVSDELSRFHQPPRNIFLLNKSKKWNKKKSPHKFETNRYSILYMYLLHNPSARKDLVEEFSEAVEKGIWDTDKYPKFHTKSSLSKDLNKMEDRGLLVRISEKPDGRGRPKELFYVNPEVVFSEYNLAAGYSEKFKDLFKCNLGPETIWWMYFWTVRGKDIYQDEGRIIKDQTFYPSPLYHSLIVNVMPKLSPKPQKVIEYISSSQSYFQPYDFLPKDEFNYQCILRHYLNLNIEILFFLLQLSDYDGKAAPLQLPFLLLKKGDRVDEYMRENYYSFLTKIEKSNLCKDDYDKLREKPLVQYFGWPRPNDNLSSHTAYDFPSDVKDLNSVYDSLVEEFPHYLAMQFLFLRVGLRSTTWQINQIKERKK
ncbi:MAG: MarR family transcriptional regulator [archaeon]